MEKSGVWSAARANFCATRPALSRREERRVGLAAGLWGSAVAAGTAHPRRQAGGDGFTVALVVGGVSVRSFLFFLFAFFSLAVVLGAFFGGYGVCVLVRILGEGPGEAFGGQGTQAGATWEVDLPFLFFIIIIIIIIVKFAPGELFYCCARCETVEFF
ncbi:hypothetical protein TcCL_ESM06212, partial [Trypanosoma cruzi]